MHLQHLPLDSASGGVPSQLDSGPYVPMMRSKPPRLMSGRVGCLVDGRRGDERRRLCRNVNYGSFDRQVPGTLSFLRVLKAAVQPQAGGRARLDSSVLRYILS